MFLSIRKKKLLSQRELATKLGVTQGAISQWESGTSHPTADKIPKIAEILGCSIDELFKEGK